MLPMFREDQQISRPSKHEGQVGLADQETTCAGKLRGSAEQETTCTVALGGLADQETTCA